MGRAKGALDKADERPQVAQAPDSKEPPRDIPPERGSEGSEMVKKDAHRHNMHPPGPMRGGPDQASYNGRMSNEQMAARMKADIARQKAENSLSLNNENNNGNKR